MAASFIDEQRALEKSSSFVDDMKALGGEPTSFIDDMKALGTTDDTGSVLGDIGRAIYDIPVQAKAAVAGAIEGTDPFA